MAKRHLSRRSQKSYVNWDKFNRFTELHPLASPTRLKDLIAMHRELWVQETSDIWEPDAVTPHVRI